MSVSKLNRRYIRDRAERHCEYCKRPEKYVSMELEIDHILPQSKGGTDNLDNLCYACQKCNGYKANRTLCIDPDTDNKATLFNPRQEKWSTHFRRSESYHKILGLTAIGRATIDCLRLNHEMLLVSRLLWANSGWIPPHD